MYLKHSEKYSKNLFSVFSAGVWKDDFKVSLLNELLHFEIIEYLL